MKSSYILFVESINKNITKKTLRRRFIKLVYTDDYAKEDLDEIINSLFKNVISK